MVVTIDEPEVPLWKVISSDMGHRIRNRIPEWTEMSERLKSAIKSATEYDGSERNRESPDTPRANDRRSEFERDRARIIHCAAFRRLQGKTQVFGLGGSDFFRTRMTHSLEVAQIGKGIALQCNHADPDLVEAVCLAHDLGHPPFGHTGEEELQHKMTVYGGFDANAQNIRVVRQLEMKSDKFDGLNLTRATIDGLLKHKKVYSEAKDDPVGKFCYDDDAKLVDWASEGNKSDCSFECQIMDWADDIAYSVHDLEDGIKAEMIDVDLLEDDVFKERVKKAFESQSGRKFEWEAYNVVYQKVQDAFFIPGGTKYNRRELARKAKRKSVMADLIDWFISSTNCEMDQSRKPTRYQCSLRVPDEVRDACHILKRIVWEAIISDERIATLERKAKTIIGILFDEFTKVRGDTRELFPQDFRERLDQAKTDGDRARVACDYIAGMTDAHAFRVYSRLREPDVTSIFEIL